MKRICNVGITCDLFPGEVDSPVQNFSSEAPDPLVFTGTYYPPINPGCLGCNPNTIYASSNCYGVVYSASSQADADAMARLAGVTCKDPTAQQYANDPQTASCACPGGSVYTYTVPAGYMATSNDPDPDAWLAAANAAALAYAEQQAASLSQRSCVVTTNLLPHPGWMCLGESLLSDSTNTYAVTGLNSEGDWEFSVISGSLPSGVTLDKSGSNTAQLSGTPTESGNFSYTIQAYRPALPYQTISVTDTLDVLEITNPSNLGAIEVCHDVSEQLNVNGGEGPYSFLSGDLPDWLTLSTDGVLSGTPQSSDGGHTYGFGVGFTDAKGRSCGKQFTISVNPCPTIVVWPTSFPNAVVGIFYGQNLSASAGTPPFNFSWNGSGTLPPGLSVDDLLDAVTGTPTASGTYTFTIQVSDKCGCSGANGRTVKVGTLGSDLIDRNYSCPGGGGIIVRVTIPANTFVVPQDGSTLAIINSLAQAQAMAQANTLLAAAGCACRFTSVAATNLGKSQIVTSNCPILVYFVRDNGNLWTSPSGSATINGTFDFYNTYHANIGSYPSGTVHVCTTPNLSIELFSLVFY